MRSKPLAHTSFVLTGKLSTLRAEAVATIERLGGLVDNHVTYDTDYLVYGKRVGGVKMEAARQYGTQVISEDELLKMLTWEKS